MSFIAVGVPREDINMETYDEVPSQPLKQIEQRKIEKYYKYLLWIYRFLIILLLVAVWFWLIIVIYNLSVQENGLKRDIGNLTQLLKRNVAPSEIWITNQEWSRRQQFPNELCSPIGSIKQIVVKHSATPTIPDTLDRCLKLFRDWEKISNRSLPHNFLICNERIFIGQGGFECLNEDRRMHSIDILFIGNFTKYQAPPWYEWFWTHIMMEGYILDKLSIVELKLLAENETKLAIFPEAFSSLQPWDSPGSSLYQLVKQSVWYQNMLLFSNKNPSF